MIFVAGALCLSLGTISCSDYLDREPKSDYLNTDFYNNEGAIRQGATGCYQRLKMDHTATSSIPYSTLWDMYTPFGIERADNASIGVGNVNLENVFVVEKTWQLLYASVARCNAVLDGAEPHMPKLNQASQVLLAEIRVLRAHFNIQLISLFGDVPLFMKSVTEQERQSATRDPWRESVDIILADLESAAQVLPWQQSGDGSWGRVDRSVALGLKARLALYTGSWLKYGHGMSGETDQTAAAEYFEIAVEASNRIMTESGRSLSPNFADLFTRVGQAEAGAKSENMLFMMFSDQGDKSTHYQSFGEHVRMIGQSGRFPTQYLVDTYETKNGLRIDQDPSYNPAKPFENRDPRLSETVYYHGSQIIGNTGGNKRNFLMNVYGPEVESFDDQGNVVMLPNADYVGSVAPYGYVHSGVGFAWKKYNHFDDEVTHQATYNIIIMRYAEILLTFAEAKIELGEIDAFAVDAINQVRARVDMPAIAMGTQAEMLQRVRRERKVELAREGLYLFDMRRWRLGEAQVDGKKTYGYPIAQGIDATNGVYPNGYDQVTEDMVPSFGAPGSVEDMNDIADYEAYAVKDGVARLRVRDNDRQWDDKFYLWPIPQTERNKCPWLTQNEGYAQ